MAPDNAVSIREYVDRIFEEKDRALALARAADLRALDLATDSLNQELRHLNELRQEVTEARGWVIGFGVAAGAIAGAIAGLVIHLTGH